MADSSGTYQATKMDSNSFSPNKTFVITYPYFAFQGDNIMVRRPFDGPGTALIEYYKLNPVMVEDTDVIPVNMQGYSTSFVSYCHAQALFKDQKIQEATFKKQEADGMRDRFVKES